MDKSESVSSQLFKAERLRQSRIEKAWRAYNGEYRKPLKTKRGEVDPNVTPNFARVLVDKSVAILFGKDVAFDVVEDELHGDSRRHRQAQAFLDTTWRRSKKLSLLQKATMNGSVGGHVFLQVVPAKPYPRIVNLDPLMVTVQTHPNDYEEVVRYRLSWTSSETGALLWWRRDFYSFAGEWFIEESYSANEEGPYTLFSQQAWPYSGSPIVEWQNLPVPNAFYGLPDLSEDILHIIDRLHLNLSNWNKTVIHHAHPTKWGSGFEADDLSTASDGTIVFPSKDAKLNLLEMTSHSMGQDNLFMRLKESLYEVSRLPEVSTGKMQNIGVLSGLALHILYQPVLELTSQKRVLAGPALEQACETLLEMGGFGGRTVSVEWPELLPGDPTLEGIVFEKDKLLGLVSQETLMRKRGYDPTLERARLAREGEKTGPNKTTKGGD